LGITGSTDGQIEGMVNNRKNNLNNFERANDRNRSIFIADERGIIREEPVIHTGSNRGEKSNCFVFKRK
jgi:hypothetical protein